jgi:hypothetical protein
VVGGQELGQGGKLETRRQKPEKEGTAMREAGQIHKNKEAGDEEVGKGYSLSAATQARKKA